MTEISPRTWRLTLIGVASLAVAAIASAPFTGTVRVVTWAVVLMATAAAGLRWTQAEEER